MRQGDGVDISFVKVSRKTEYLLAKMRHQPRPFVSYWLEAESSLPFPLRDCRRPGLSLGRVFRYTGRNDDDGEGGGVAVFQYGDEEVAYLAARDPKLAEVMAVVGHIEREVTPDLFAALVNSIVGQQISTKAQITIWNRMLEMLGEVTPEAVAACSDDELQRVGISFRKASYIKGAAGRVLSGELNLEALHDASDDEVRRALSALPGVGVWTAEMLMIFSMQRPNILSWGDFAIQRGLRMVYHHRRITPELFAKYRRRYAPYGSVASLYLWAVSGGAVPGMKDWAPKKK